MSFSSLFDPLICQEDPFIEEEPYKPIDLQLNLIIPIEPNSDSFEFLSSLITNEQKTHNFSIQNDPYLHSARREAVQWIKATSSRFGFNGLTVLLAVNYLDRCFLCSDGLRLQHDKPWMKQLSAVACLSLAAKVEETQVPFLLDLQVSSDENVRFVFESKTIRRMELLVLSTLGWRMNPVTPIAFIQCILPKFENGDDDDDNNNVVEILRSCETILLSVLTDWRWVQFPPSIWALAAMLHAMGQHLDEMHHLYDLLNVSKERVEQCHGLIVELMDTGVNNRKSCFIHPPSPNDVIGSCFSYESSSSLDSWAMWPSSSVSSSPEPPPKRPKCSIF